MRVDVCFDVACGCESECAGVVVVLNSVREFVCVDVCASCGCESVRGGSRAKRCGCVRVCGCVYVRRVSVRVRGSW